MKVELLETLYELVIPLLMLLTYGFWKDMIREIQKKESKGLIIASICFFVLELFGLAFNIMAWLTTIL